MTFQDEGKFGHLQICMKEAQFDRDTAMFMSMNPKYVINWKEEKMTGKAADGGGTNPKWYGEHDLNIGGDPSSAGVITFTFLDGDSLIAACQIPATKLTDQPTKEEFYDITYENGWAGKVLIGTAYKGGGGGIVAQPGMAQMQPAVM